MNRGFFLNRVSYKLGYIIRSLRIRLITCLEHRLLYNIILAIFKFLKILNLNDVSSNIESQKHQQLPPLSCQSQTFRPFISISSVLNDISKQPMMEAATSPLLDVSAQSQLAKYKSFNANKYCRGKSGQNFSLYSIEWS